MWCLTFWKSQVLSKCDVLHISCSKVLPQGLGYSKGSKVQNWMTHTNLRRPFKVRSGFSMAPVQIWDAAILHLVGYKQWGSHSAAEAGHVNLLTQSWTGGAPFSELHTLNCQAIHCWVWSCSRLHYRGYHVNMFPDEPVTPHCIPLTVMMYARNMYIHNNCAHFTHFLSCMHAYPFVFSHGNSDRQDQWSSRGTCE